MYALSSTAGTARPGQEIYLDHSQCTRIDLGASVVMDVIAVDLERTWPRRRRRPSFAGAYPKDQEAREILRTTGIIRHLKVSHERPARTDRYLLFPLYRGSSARIRARQTSDHERAAQKLTEYFDECLGKQGSGLESQGKKAISQMAGEILNNAEEHSERSTWFLMAYMRQEDQDVGQCNIALFNFGRTVYQTLCLDDTAPELRRKMTELSNLHRRRKLFGPRWTEETLWTLYSLQEGVSRFRDRQPDRGYGTVRMIELFLQLGQRLDGVARPKMALVSGSSHILFDGTYGLAIDPRGGDRKVIAFNASNDLEEPPDPEYVKSIDGLFPGTLISMRFFLDRRNLCRR